MYRRAGRTVLTKSGCGNYQNHKEHSCSKTSPYHNNITQPRYGVLRLRFYAGPNVCGSGTRWLMQVTVDRGLCSRRAGNVAAGPSSVEKLSKRGASLLLGRHPAVLNVAGLELRGQPDAACGVGRGGVLSWATPREGATSVAATTEPCAARLTPHACMRARSGCVHVSARVGACMAWVRGCVGACHGVRRRA